MSLGSNYVKAVDNLWYQDVVIKGHFESRKWFVVFDDKDPPELVIEGSEKKQERQALAQRLITSLKTQGLVLGITCPGSVSNRFFESNLKKSTPAFSYFVELTKRLPNQFIDGRKKGFKDPPGEGLYLDPEIK